MKTTSSATRREREKPRASGPQNKITPKDLARHIDELGLQSDEQAKRLDEIESRLEKGPLNRSGARISDDEIHESQVGEINR